MVTTIKTSVIALHISTLHLHLSSFFPAVTASNVSIVQSQTAFLSEPLDLTCITFFDQSVNAPVHVTHDWTTPSGVVITERGSAITGSYQQYRSTLSFSSLQSNDSGIYICVSTVNDSLSEYVTSDTVSTWTTLNTSNDSLSGNVVMLKNVLVNDLCP